MKTRLIVDVGIWTHAHGGTCVEIPRWRTAAFRPVCVVAERFFTDDAEEAVRSFWQNQIDDMGRK